MKKCCVDTAYRVEEDYRKRVKELEAAMQEFVDMKEWFDRQKDYMKDMPELWQDQLIEKINKQTEGFKELLK